MTSEPSWTPPGDGVWWLVREHFPAPVSGLFAALFPPVTVGWHRGAARYGLPMGDFGWATVNGWMYYREGTDDPGTYPSLEATAEATLVARAWRDEVERWFSVERPAVVEANRALQAEILEALDNDELADHLHRAVDHFLAVAPLHFEHMGFDLAAGLLFARGAEWGLTAGELTELLSGASGATSAPGRHLHRIAAAPAGAEADAALANYLADFGWRLLGANDLIAPTLAERPELLRPDVTVVAAGPDTPDVESVRSRVPVGERAHFDELLADARLAYPLRDDDGGVAFSWPLGLVRRAVLQAAVRLTGRDRLLDPVHLFEADPSEIDALLAGTGGLPAGELAERADFRRRAGLSQPPIRLGDAAVTSHEPAELPPNVARLVAARDAYGSASWPEPSTDRLRGTGIGREPRRGRACVFDATIDAIDDLRPGDVLVAPTTTPTHNVIFPLVVAAATGRAVQPHGDPGSRARNSRRGRRGQAARPGAHG